MSDDNLKLSPAALLLAKNISHEIWQKYGDEHGYRTEKQSQNATVNVNVPGNIWFFWGQFDHINQGEFFHKVHTAVDDNIPGAGELLIWVIPEMARTQAAVDMLRDEGIEL